MTAVMQLLRWFPGPEPESWPPRQITEQMGRRVGITQHLDRDQRSALAWLSHFAYGATGGALYALLVKRAMLPPIVAGMGNGLAVWAGSYLGWLPAAGILRSATRQNLQRNAMLIASHVAWDGVLGILADRLQSDL